MSVAGVTPAAILELFGGIMGGAAAAFIVGGGAAIALGNGGMFGAIGCCGFMGAFMLRPLI